MNKIVQKWAAGFDMNDEVVLAQYSFRVTPQFFFMEPVKDAEGRRMQIVLGFQTRFNQQQDGVLLHDTPLSALKALAWRQQQLIQNAQGKINHAKERQTKIKRFLEN